MYFWYYITKIPLLLIYIYCRGTNRHTYKFTDKLKECNIEPIFQHNKHNIIKTEERPYTKYCIILKPNQFILIHLSLCRHHPWSSPRQTFAVTPGKNYVVSMQFKLLNLPTGHAYAKVSMMLALTVNGIPFYNHYQFLSIKRSTFFTFGQYVYSPIHTLLKLLPFVGSTKRWEEKNQLFPSLCNKILGFPVMKSLWIKFIPSICGLFHPVEIKIHKENRLLTSNEKVTNIYTTKAIVKNLWVFLQRWCVDLSIV